MKLWKDVLYCKLNHEHSVLIKLSNGREINVSKDYSGWYVFIQKIPASKLLDSQIPDFLDDYRTSLSLCQICGFISFQENECLSCGSERFTDKLLDKFKNEIEYIRAGQLSVFSTDDEEDVIDFYVDSTRGFQKDKDWKPIVTKEEVMSYSKENYCPKIAF